MTHSSPEDRLRRLSAAMQEGKDIHRIHAAEKFSIPESEVTPEQRDEAKRELFRMMYTPPAPKRWKFSELDREGDDVRVVELHDVDYSSLEKRAAAYMASSAFSEAAQACSLCAAAVKKFSESMVLVQLIDGQDAELACATLSVKNGVLAMDELSKALREANETLERAEKLQITYSVPASVPRKRGEAQWKRESRGRFTGR